MCLSATHEENAVAGGAVVEDDYECSKVSRGGNVAGLTDAGLADLEA